ISGMHITLFAWVAAGLVNALWRRSARAMLWIPAPLAARWCGLALALAYALLAGWGLPAQRTVGMLGLTVLMRSLGAPWPPALLCLVAGALVVLWDPWALLQPGFWLSFMAVGLLIASDAGQGRMAADGLVVAPARAETPPGGRRWRALLDAGKSGLRGQWLVTVGLAPLTLLLFQQLSLVGLLANLVAVPLVTWVVTPLALAGVAWPACWTAAGWVLQPLLAWLGWLASWPHAVWHVPAASAWAAGLALLGAALLMLPLPWRLRALAVPLCLPLLWPPVQRPAPGEFELIAADVGQGSAVIVRTAGHTLLHDAGPQFNAETDAGQRVLLPLLQSMGTTQLDELLLSHRDADHVGGAASVLAGLPVQRLRSTLDPAHPLRASPVPHLDCAAGQRWVWDGVAFEVLHPQPGASRLGVKPNHLSCVLRVRSAAGQSALITGDLEAEQEGALVHRLGAALQSTVLLVPHHGSRTSSTPDFLAAVQPQWSVVQAAYRSRFGHPHPEVLARYQARGLALVRTDQCGAWIWQSNGATCTRDVRRRYWHWRDRPALPVAGAVVANPPTVGDRE
ncbi:DNA internalization-related competence protein ComEC/Rec2, partial [Ideonella sp.]|uniref:DNA internalization-related competence protein ComEC/Rec2 n=1 Tax=Ideonella sp. TaxID=1929293 RepID=UPI003BB7DE80